MRPKDSRLRAVEAAITRRQVAAAISQTMISPTPSVSSIPTTVTSPKFVTVATTKPQPVQHKSVQDILTAAARVRLAQKTGGLTSASGPILIPVSPQNAAGITVIASPQKQTSQIISPQNIAQLTQVKRSVGRPPKNANPIILTTVSSPQKGTSLLPSSPGIRRITLPAPLQAVSLANKPSVVPATKIQIPAGSVTNAQMQQNSGTVFKLSSTGGQQYMVTLRKADGTTQQISLDQLNKQGDLKKIIQNVTAGQQIKPALPVQTGLVTSSGIRIIRPQASLKPGVSPKFQSVNVVNSTIRSTKPNILIRKKTVPTNKSLNTAPTLSKGMCVPSLQSALSIKSEYSTNMS